MKKLLALLAALALVFTLAACSDTSVPSAPSAPSAPEAPSSVAPPAPEAASVTSESAPAETSTPSAATPKDTAGDGIVGQWQVDQFGLMGVYFTVDELEALIALAEAQGESMPDGATSAEMVAAFRTLTLECNADGSGVISMDYQGQSMDQPFSWSGEGRSYTFHDLDSSQYDLRYNQDDDTLALKMSVDVSSAGAGIDDADVELILTRA